MLPTVATEGARLVRVMLSLTLPSPLIFTLNGLPVIPQQVIPHLLVTHVTEGRNERFL